MFVAVIHVFLEEEMLGYIEAVPSYGESEGPLRL